MTDFNHCAVPPLQQLSESLQDATLLLHGNRHAGPMRWRPKPETGVEPGHIWHVICGIPDAEVIRNEV